jgi:Prokaryotic membrane lipoprotein lipid attachment site
MKQILLALFAVIMVAGCNHPKPKFDVCGVTKIEISYPQGGTVITDSVVIRELADAMLKGKPDNGVYDTAKNILITAYKGDSITWRMSAGSPFVDVNGQQYRCPEFHAVLQKLTTKSKKSTQLNYQTKLENIHSDLVITSCEKEIRLKHVAALEWFDSNKVIVGEPASSIRDFLSRALVKTSHTGIATYKFPLASPAGNALLGDEPRAQYNHYFVTVNEGTGLISGKGFNRYGW